jgi:DNA helicase-2/ATP-dependent DNA helicase PcrA
MSQRKMTIKPSPQQVAAKSWVKEDQGNLIVEAVAGAGKTTLLVSMLGDTTGEVAFCAYNKAIADEIGEKVIPLNLGNRVKTGTCHSFGFAALRTAYRNIKVDNKKMFNLAKETIENWELRGFCMAAASMAKQVGAGIDPDFDWVDMINHFSLYDSLPDGVGLNEAIGKAQELLRVSTSRINKVVDFDDMIYGPLVKKLPFKKYDWVFLDEAQDTNVVRREMVRRLLKSDGRLVAVGDPHQAIYGFTGADHLALDNIQKEFDAKRLPLTVTFRCPKSIVEHAQAWVSHIQAHESAPEGIIDRMSVAQAVANKEFGPNDAVLCRLTKPLIELAYSLLRENVAVRVEGRAIGEGLVKLATKWKKVKTVGQLSEKLAEWAQDETLKAIQRDNNDRCAVIEDQVSTLNIMIDNCDAQDPISVLVTNIRNLFSDSDGNHKKVLTLSTIHRSKGREWDRVFALDMDKFSPCKWAKKDWELVQENNLCYVQVTRAKKRLTLLSYDSGTLSASESKTLGKAIKQLTKVDV